MIEIGNHEYLNHTKLISGSSCLQWGVATNWGTSGNISSSGSHRSSSRGLFSVLLLICSIVFYLTKQIKDTHPPPIGDRCSFRSNVGTSSWGGDTGAICCCRGKPLPGTYHLSICRFWDVLDKYGFLIVKEENAAYKRFILWALISIWVPVNLMRCFLQCASPGIVASSEDCRKFWLCKEEEEGSRVLEVRIWKKITWTCPFTFLPCSLCYTGVPPATYSALWSCDVQSKKRSPVLWTHLQRPTSGEHLF